MLRIYRFDKKLNVVQYFTVLDLSYFPSAKRFHRFKNQACRNQHGAMKKHKIASIQNCFDVLSHIAQPMQLLMHPTNLPQNHSLIRMKLYHSNSKFPKCVTTYNNINHCFKITTALGWPCQDNWPRVSVRVTREIIILLKWTLVFCSIFYKNWVEANKRHSQHA